MTKCTRWAELVAAIKFHAGLARTARAPTEFRFLNIGQPYLVGAGDDTTGYVALMNALEGSPNGGTPLCRHIHEIPQYNSLFGMEVCLVSNY